MKIVIATPLYPPEIGGPATYTKELAERLRTDHQITIVAYASTAEPIPGVTLLTASKRRMLPIRLLKFTLLLFRASKGVDVIYVQNAVAAGLPAMIIGLLRKVPVVLKFVGDEAWERATQLRQTTEPLEEFLAHPAGSFRIRVFQFIQGIVLRHVSLVTTPSEYLRNAVVRAYRIKPDRAIVNYNAAEKTETLPFESIPTRHQLVTSARLVEWKGVDGIIDAVALLQHTYPDITLMVAGDGPEKERLKARAVEKGVGDRVIFLGRVSRAETWHLRTTSELYILNSTYEGLPHTVLTSFAAGIPTIATDVPGTNEAVYHEKTGLLVPPNNPEALAAAIARLFENPDFAQQLATRGGEMLQEKFSWNAHVTTLLSLLARAQELR